MKHYGIWITSETNKGAWLKGGHGLIFWTTSRAIAEAQLDYVKDNMAPMFNPVERMFEIREFE